MGEIEKWCIELGIENEMSGLPGRSGCLREFGRVFGIDKATVSRHNRGEAISPRIAELIIALTYLKKKGWHHGYANYRRKQNSKAIK